MDINAEKIELAKQVLDIKDERVLHSIKAALNGVDYDWWNELDKDVKASIERGLKQSQEGDLYDHEEVLKTLG